MQKELEREQALREKEERKEMERQRKEEALRLQQELKEKELLEQQNKFKKLDTFFVQQNNAVVEKTPVKDPNSRIQPLPISTTAF